MEHMIQPDGITCGPTAVAMIHGELLRRTGRSRLLDVGHIGSMCGTNPRTGTVHEGIATAFAGLGISSERILGRDRSLPALASALDRGDMVLCRTLTCGTKHWVLAWGRDANGRVLVADPAVGRIVLTPAQLAERISHRDYEIWTVPADQTAYEVVVDDFPSVDPGVSTGAHALCRTVFGRFMPQGLEEHLDRRSDWSASRRVVVDGDTVGVYLLRPSGLPDWADRTARERTRNLRGVAGIALAVDPDRRNRGYGRILKDEPERMGYDFVWGEQLRDLGNIEQWKRRREVLGERFDSYLSAEIFGGRPLVDEQETDETPSMR